MLRRTMIIAFTSIFLIDLGGLVMAVEQPAYQVELDAKPFQIRLYAPSIVASIQVAGTRGDAVSSGFRSLADYIFGKNQKKSKIAMTAPVTQTPGEKIAMTAPVSQSPSEKGWEVRFTMPAGETMESLPVPEDRRVELSDVPSRRMAVIVFSGFWSDANFQSHAGELMTFVKQRGLTPISAPIYAYYNPPWMPWFMRTNEVQVQIAE